MDEKLNLTANKDKLEERPFLFSLFIKKGKAEIKKKKIKNKLVAKFHKDIGYYYKIKDVDEIINKLTEEKI